jgi:hypothetical protein
LVVTRLLEMLYSSCACAARDRTIRMPVKNLLMLSVLHKPYHFQYGLITNV